MPALGSFWGAVAARAAGGFAAGFSGTLLHGLSAPVDAAEILLNYQGIPTVASLNAIRKGFADTLQAGHSNGAGEMANLEGLGVIGRGKTVSALPFGKVAPSGVNVEIGNKDIINGFGLGKFFNPSAQIVKQLDWFDHTIGRYRQSHSNIFNP